MIYDLFSGLVFRRVSWDSFAAEKGQYVIEEIFLSPEVVDLGHVVEGEAQ